MWRFNRRSKTLSSGVAAPPEGGDPIRQEPSELCTICQSPADRERYRCNRCEDVSYCSSECLETDESVHALACETFEAYPPPLLPEQQKHGISMVRCLVFEANADRPKFIWVSVKADNPVGLQEYLGTRHCEIKIDSLCKDGRRNAVRDRPLRDQVKVYAQRGFKKMEDNNSIRRVIGMCRLWLEFEFHGTRGYGGHLDIGKRIEDVQIDVERYPWKGNVAFMIYKKSAQKNIPHFRDINLTDFRDIVDFLSVQEHDGLQYDPLARLRARKINIVHMYTEQEGERKMFHERQHIVPQDHPLIRDQGTSNNWGRLLQFSQHIGIPLYAVRLNNYLRSRPIHQDAGSPEFPWEPLVLRSLLDPRDSNVPSASNSPNNAQDSALTSASDSPINPLLQGNGISSSASASRELWKAGYENDNHLSVVLVRGDRKDLRSMDIEVLATWMLNCVIPNLGDDHPRSWTDGRYAQLFTKQEYDWHWHKLESVRLGLSSVLPCGTIVAGHDRLRCPYNL